MRTWRTAADGAAAVEFALVLPLLTLLIVGFLELGRLFWSYHIATGSVRDAARYGARLAPSCNIDPTTGQAYGLDVGATQQVINLARTGAFNPGGAPLISGWTSDASVSVTVVCVANGAGGVRTFGGVYRGEPQIPVVNVKATVPYAMLFSGLLGGLGSTSFTVSHRETWTQ